MQIIKIKIKSDMKPSVLINGEWQTMTQSKTKTKDGFYEYIYEQKVVDPIWYEFYKDIQTWSNEQQLYYLQRLYEMKYLVVKQLAAITGKSKEDINPLIQKGLQKGWLIYERQYIKKTPAFTIALHEGLNWITTRQTTKQIQSISSEKVQSVNETSKELNKQIQKKMYREDSADAMIANE